LNTIMTTAVRRATLLAGAVGTLAVAVFALATPAHAAGTATDLSVTLATKTDAVPGKRVAYRVSVHNAGQAAATRVQIDFTTTAPLGSVGYSIANGHCYRSPTEIACIFYSNLRPGATATATISGVLPRSTGKGTLVVNKVTLASNTRLVNPADDRAVASYRVGEPGAVGSSTRPAPGATPSSSVNPDSKLLKVTNTASRVLGYSRHAVALTVAALAAACAWFAIGLTLRRRARIARGDRADD
jgi:uncharacterized repeat protein (TIGR01451 family)